MRKTIKMHVSKAMVIACVHGKLGGVFGVPKTMHEMGVMDNGGGKDVMSSHRKSWHQLRESVIKERKSTGDLGAKELDWPSDALGR